MRRRGGFRQAEKRRIYMVRFRRFGGFPLDKKPDFAVSYKQEKNGISSRMTGPGETAENAAPKGKRKNSQAKGSDSDEAPERKGTLP